MKRKLIIILVILIALLGGLFYKFIYLKIAPKNPETILSDLKELKSYSSDIHLELKNSKQTIEENCKQSYMENVGYRLDIGNDRVWTFLKDKSVVKDLTNSKIYETEKDFDVLYKYTFVNQYINLLFSNEEYEISSEEENGKKFMVVTLSIYGESVNLKKGALYIDEKTKLPYKLLIFNEKDSQVVEVKYENFVANPKINNDVFDLRK
ncbi:MAG: germination lipoprotein GerS-related protein [Clostridiaceae bacterium]